MAMGDADEPVTETDHEYRVDDLARAAGVTTTTIRLYQSKGLLPPPRLVGRTGYYGAAHLTRLGVIGQLQEQGFSLAGIAALIQRWESGGGLAGLLGAEQEVNNLLGRRTAVILDAPELLARFPAGSMEPELIQRAGAMGLVEVTDDGRFRIPDERFIESGAALAQMGVPLVDILDEWAALSTMTDAVASRFADLFERHLLPDSWQEGLDEEQVADLAADLRRLRTLGEQVLLAALDDALARVTASRFAELASEADRVDRPASAAPTGRS